MFPQLLHGGWIEIIVRRDVASAQLDSSFTACTCAVPHVTPRTSGVRPRRAKPGRRCLGFAFHLCVPPAGLGLHPVEGEPPSAVITEPRWFSGFLCDSEVTEDTPCPRQNEREVKEYGSYFCVKFPLVFGALFEIHERLRVLASEHLRTLKGFYCEDGSMR